MGQHLDMNSKGRLTAYSTPAATMLARIELSGRVTQDLWEENSTETLIRRHFIRDRMLEVRKAA